MEKVCNACRKIEKELSQFLKKYLRKKRAERAECEKEGNKTRKSIPGRPHAEEKVGIKTDPIRQKSGKVVKNCGFYEKNDGKRQECCRNILVDKKM